jgi:hypothetical protein
MNWTPFLFAFCLAVITAAIAATVIARMRPHWSPRKQLLCAAFALPSATLLATLLGLLAILLTGPGPGENMQDLAIAAVGTIGLLFTLIAMVGGLVGALLRQRGMRR